MEREDDNGAREGRGLRYAVAAAAALAGMAWYVRRKTREVDEALPPRGEMLDVDGLRVHCVTRGRGPAVVLLHGNGSRIEELEASGLPDLLARDHTVVMIDRPGFGHSERPAHVAWTADAQASLVARVLATRGIERATVVGHSWGTLVALALAIDHKALVSGVVVVDGYYHAEFRPDTWLLSMPAWPLVGAVVSRTTSPVTARLLWPALLRVVFGPAEAPPRFRALSPWAFLRPSSLRAAGEESGWMNAEARKLETRYAEIEAPVMILAGTRDRIVDDDEHVDPLRRALDDAEARTFPGVGHMLHHTHPEAVAQAVAQVEAKAKGGHGLARALVPDAAALLPQSETAVRASD